MNTEIRFTLSQVLIILLIVLIGFVGAYFTILLYRLGKTVAKINSILDSNKESIDNTMKSVPGIVSNVNDITCSVKKKTDLLDNLFKDKKNDEDDSGVQAFSGLETLISSLTSLVELISEVKGFFTKRQKKYFKIKR